MADRDGYEVRFLKVGNTVDSVWLYTTDFSEATQECDILIKKDFVESVKLMKIKEVQVFKIDKNNETICS